MMPNVTESFSFSGKQSVKDPGQSADNADHILCTIVNHQGEQEDRRSGEQQKIG